MLSARRTGAGDRSERGFTLVEVLVAMLCGVVITAALFAILEVSLHQSGRLASRTESTQLGRTAMNKVVSELHSACLSKEFAPVQSGASSNELLFVTALGPGAKVKEGGALLEEAFEHDIVYSSSAHTLTDKAWKSTGGSWPTFTFPATSTTPTSTVRLAENVKPIGGESEPVFKYYEYAKASNTTEAVDTFGTSPMTAPLTSTTAAEAAGVWLGFQIEPALNRQYKQTSELTELVSLSFSVPSAETPVVAKPCE